ncbi:origin recognition complex subunit 4 [Rhodotorula kratochvilovae]
MSIVGALKRRQSSLSGSAARGQPILPSDPSARMPCSPSPPPTLALPVVKEAPPPAPSRPARMPTPASTPTKRQPAREKKTQTPVRSTRSSGKADYFQPLDGAPPVTKKPAARAKAPPRRQKAIVRDTEDEESETEIIVPPRRTAGHRTPTKAGPTRRASVKKERAPRLPCPSPEAEEVVADSVDENVEEEETAASEVDEPAASSPPSRKRAQRVAHLPLPPSPALSTPSKKRAASVASSTAKAITPLPKRARREAVASDAEEDVFGPIASTSSSTPRKDVSSTPATTPSRSSSKTVTPSRSSSRIQRLPPSAVEIANAPASLRNRLVGFHMEDEGYGVEAARERGQTEERDSEDEEIEEDEEEVARRRAAKGKGKARMMDEDEQEEDVEMAAAQEEDDVDFAFTLDQHQPLATMTTATQPLATADSSYLSSPLCTHLASTLALLSGARLPRPFLASNAKSTLPPRKAGVLALPYLEGGYDEWERPLRSALDECVTKGMGNAVMLLGPRGVGKTMIVERTLALLSHVHGADTFVTVRLSGLVHTTDRLALRSIAVQLQEQGFGTADLIADEGDYSSNSATMSTLLRLLEPSTASTAASTSTGAASSASAAQGKSKPLVLVVDEFDLFAAHPRQSFLYCLLDIVQGNRRSGGFAVVGVSARVDCLSLLEKRVRSRCQSHVLQMIPRSSFTAFGEHAARLLRADERAWELVRGREGKEWAKEWNEEVERFLKEKKVVEYLNRLWSIHGNVPTELRSALSHLCYRLDYQSRMNGLDGSSSVPRLSLDMLKPQPRGEDKVRDDVFKHLSIPQLTALIAAKHLSTSTLDRQAGFNFEMVYDGYLAHVRRVSASTTAGGTMRALSKPALREAFDALRARELVLPRASSGAGGGALTAGTGLPVAVPSAAYRTPTQRDPWKMYRLTTWAKDVDREVEARGAECPLALRRWCKNWLD